MISDLLKQVPLFANLTGQEYEMLAGAMMVRKFPKDCMVIWAEDEGDSFFVIQSGSVKVTVNASDGREMILSSLGPRDFFGDMSLLDGEPRSANVVTLSVTEALVLRRVDFLKALQRHPTIAVHLMVALASRLRKADHQTANLALLGIADRISQVLMEIAAEQGVKTAEGIVIRKRPTHQTIASMSGTARETVTRILKHLSDDGYIRSRGKELLIVKRDDSIIE
ncbi:MAG: Crp/Fnr family transcriptional regulator [bacterium]|nr:Crp/Fnr family transcriptional regulator [bacterium]